jgi:hypothetical protein
MKPTLPSMSVAVVLCVLSPVGMGAAASAAVVSFSKTFVNNTSSTQTYTYSMMVPVLEGYPTAMMSGQVTATLIDLNGNGASLGNDGTTAIYTAVINGNAVQTLWNAPFSYSAPAYGSESTPAARFEQVPFTVAENIEVMEVRIRLRLSARDMVTVRASFDVIPAPGALALLGLAGFARSRRR